MEKKQSRMKENIAKAISFDRNLLNLKLPKAKNHQSKNCRQNLENLYEHQVCNNSSSSSDRNDRSVLSVLSLNTSRRVLRSGAEKLQKTVSSLCTSVGTLSQKFKSTTRRRQLLEEGPATPCVSPRTRSKHILGRTPTKLYSPFGIEAPNKPRRRETGISGASS